MKNLFSRAGRQIEERLQLRYFLPLLCLALATTWYGLFFSTAEFREMTGGLSFMDMQPGLRADSLFAQIRLYSDATVDYYIIWVLFDYLWPFVTYTTMLFITRWLLNFSADKWQQWFWFFVASAYATVVMDWGENTGFIALVSGLPDEPAWLAQLTLALHAAKLFFNMLFNLAFFTLLIGVLLGYARKFFAKSA
jgi:hypothetical protein